MQEANHIMPRGHFLHQLHNQLVMVGGYIRFAVNRSKFMLSRSRFIMLCLGVNPQLPKFLVQLPHKGGNPVLYGPVVMVLHFLTFGRRGAE